MAKDNILVLGSKPDSNLPDVEVKKIYTANGAAERAITYRKKYNNNILTCITGASEFFRNEYVSKRIIDSKPQKLIIRSGIISLPISLKNKTELSCISNKKQWLFQSNFFILGKVSLILGELNYYKSFFKSSFHTIKAIKNKKLQGVSSGFYAILVAIFENPNANIIISGIGMQGGKQFYKSERSNYFVYDSRARVDRFLIKKMKKSLKKNMYSLDEELVNTANITRWDNNRF